MRQMRRRRRAGLVGADLFALHLSRLRLVCTSSVPYATQEAGLVGADFLAPHTCLPHRCLGLVDKSKL